MAALCGAAALALSTLGCAGLGTSPEGAPGVEEREVWLKDGTLHLRLSIPESPPGRKPLVLSPLGDREALLRRGFALGEFQIDFERLRERLGAAPPGAPEAPAAGAASAAPESPGTAGEGGERVGRWLLAAPRPGIVGRGYFGLIAMGADSVSPVLDHVASLPEIDPERIAIAGSSTQGFVALEALSREPRLAAAVVRVACGDYRRFLRSSSLALHDDPRWLVEGELRLDPEYAAELDAREPLRRAREFPPRPLLLLVGRRDEAIPLGCARRTADVLGAAYAEAEAADRFQMVVFDGAGHELGELADVLALHWWERWLAAPPRGEAP